MTQARNVTVTIWSRSIKVYVQHVQLLPQEDCFEAAGRAIYAMRGQYQCWGSISINVDDPTADTIALPNACPDCQMDHA